MRRIVVGLMAALCSLSSVLVAQQPRELQLGRPTAAYPGEFSLVHGIRELSDGSVLVADPTDAKLRKLDPALHQTATMIGTIGSGPERVPPARRGVAAPRRLDPARRPRQQPAGTDRPRPGLRHLLADHGRQSGPGRLPDDDGGRRRCQRATLLPWHAAAGRRERLAAGQSRPHRRQQCAGDRQAEGTRHQDHHQRRRQQPEPEHQDGAAVADRRLGGVAGGVGLRGAFGGLPRGRDHPDRPGWCTGRRYRGSR